MASSEIKSSSISWSNKALVPFGSLVMGESTEGTRPSSKLCNRGAFVLRCLSRLRQLATIKRGEVDGIKH